MHIPVLEKEVIYYLKPKSNENFIDCTIGEGGHTLAILEQILANGQVLGIDITSELIEELKIKSQKLKIKSNLILVNDSYPNLKKIVEKYNFQKYNFQKYNFKKVSGILFDLGLSSWHLEKSGRGFSFLKDEPLDMRYQATFFRKLTAQDIINNWSKEEIEKILKEYGEERFAKRIAQKIREERKIKPIKTTFQLVEIIKKAIPSWYHHKKIHFATRTFQALRIAVNDELNNLEKALPQALEILEKGGRLVIISFHSLEDRIVKNFFKKSLGVTSGKLKILTKKPIRPTAEEIKVNPRSRSAKLRAALKL